MGEQRRHLSRALQDSRQSFPGTLTIIFSISPPALQAGNHSRHLQGPGPEHNPGLALEGFCKQGEGRKEEREEDGLTTWVAILSITFSLPPRMSRLNSGRYLNPLWLLTTWTTLIVTTNLCRRSHVLGTNLNTFYVISLSAHHNLLTWVVLLPLPHRWETWCHLLGVTGLGRTNPRCDSVCFSP